MIRAPQREQKAAFAIASKPHWGHLIADRLLHAPSEIVRAQKQSRLCRSARARSIPHTPAVRRSANSAVHSVAVGALAATAAFVVFVAP
jgi:hypothetical protein